MTLTNGGSTISLAMRPLEPVVGLVQVDLHSISMISSEDSTTHLAHIKEVDAATESSISVTKTLDLSLTSAIYLKMMTLMTNLEICSMISIHFHFQMSIPMFIAMDFMRFTPAAFRLPVKVNMQL